MKNDAGVKRCYGARFALAFVIFVAAFYVAGNTYSFGQEAKTGVGGLTSKAGQMTDSKDAIMTYVINPLDRLLIVVYAGERQIESFEEYVKSDGSVYLPFLSQDIMVGGLRVLDAEDALEDKSKSFIKEPRVVITVLNSYTQTVSTYGKIRNVDVELRNPMRILQVIARAGGPEDGARADSIRVISDDGSVRFFNYERVNKNPNNFDNFYVHPGDIIFVPGDDDFSVMVIGSVNRPGKYSMGSGTKLLDALVKAGSWTADADVKNCRLMRVRIGLRVQVYEIDLREMFDKGKIDQNYILHDGDMIFIPAQKTREYITTLYTLFMLISSVISVIVFAKG